MSNMTLTADRPVLSVTVDTLVEEHGKWRVVLETIKAMVRSKRRTQTVRAEDLPDWVRRDIGLPTAVDPPRMPTVMMVYARP